MSDRSGPGGAAGAVHARPGWWARPQPWRRGGLAAAAVVLVAFPLVVTAPTITTIAVYCVMYMAIATAWNAFCGYSGYVSLGHAVFFGAGAYTIALVAAHLNLGGGWPLFALVPAGGLVAGVVALPIGYVALRTRRHTFVVITIAVFFICQLLAFNLGVTEGSAGVVLPSGQFSAAAYDNPFYYVSLGIFAFTLLLSLGIRRSRFGLQLFAIRDDEERARSLGVKVVRVKLSAFAISAVPVGMVGAVWAFFVGQVFPQFAFNPSFDITVALMAFIGGLGTVAGPVLGALVLEALQRYLIISLSIQNLYLVIYGLLFLAVIVLLPDGVLPSVARVWRSRRFAPAVPLAAGEPDGSAARGPADGARPA